MARRHEDTHHGAQRTGVVEAAAFASVAVHPTAAPGALHVCESCGSGLAQPTDWAPAGSDHWTVVLRCPECEAVRTRTAGQDEVDAFDEELDNGADSLAKDLRVLARSNFEHDIERFVTALHAEHLLPEDF